MYVCLFVCLFVFCSLFKLKRTLGAGGGAVSILFVENGGGTYNFQQQLSSPKSKVAPNGRSCQNVVPNSKKFPSNMWLSLL